MAAFVAPENQLEAETAYEGALLAELAQICVEIPHEDLAVQWDVAVEYGVLEGVWPVQFGDPKEGIVERLARIGKAVPPDVELEYHLCYGDYDHQHFVEPTDTSKLVTIANRVNESIDRPITWIHMPVPRDRDDAYYAPLAGLTLRPETELYLGLVHAMDGEEGANRRIAAARRIVSSFGVATECGFGRRPPVTIRGLLELHAVVADPISCA